MSSEETRVRYFVIRGEGDAIVSVFRDVKTENSYFLDRYTNSGWVRDESLAKYTLRAEPGADEVNREEALEIIKALSLTAYEDEISKQVTRPALLDILGPELLSEILRLTPKTISIKIKKGREFSQASERRIDFLCQVAYNLRMCYADAGVRGWFKRKKIGADHKTPAELLSIQWSPNSPIAIEVMNSAISARDSNSS